VAAISLSERAVQKIRQLAAGKGESVGLRVMVVGGGCSGLQYRMEIDTAKDRDKIFERDGARLIVDKKSFLYLNGSELDYSEELMSSGFKIVNPNAKRSCGCGDSFVV
jgi:iron-sulfur cluster assembly protein